MTTWDVPGPKPDCAPSGRVTASSAEEEAEWLRQNEGPVRARPAQGTISCQSLP